MHMAPKDAAQTTSTTLRGSWRTPADGSPVTANRPRMGNHSGFSGCRTPKMGFRLTISKIEPTCSCTVHRLSPGVPSYVEL